MRIARILNLRDNLIGDPGIKAGYGSRFVSKTGCINWASKATSSVVFFEFAGDLMLLEKQ